MADNVALVGRTAGHLRLKTLATIDMRENCKAATLGHEIENIHHAVRAPGIRLAAVDQCELGVKPRQRIQRRQISENMAMGLRQFDRRDYQQACPVRSLNCSGDPADLVVICDRD